MADKLQGRQFIRLRAQNAQQVMYPRDKTIFPNLLVNVSIESLFLLRHAECIKLILKLFQVILLEMSKRPIFSSSCRDYSWEPVHIKVFNKM